MSEEQFYRFLVRLNEELNRRYGGWRARREEEQEAFKAMLKARGEDDAC